MADATYQPKVYMKQGGDELVIASGGIISADGTQASHIADANVAHALSDSFDDEESEAALNALGTTINAILAALEGAGILKTS